MTYNQRNQILSLRNTYLQNNPDAFKGNSKERKEYLEKLEQIKPELTKFQKEYIIGLNLSDANIEINRNAKTARIKIQQSIKNVTWLEHVREILLEYMPSDKPFKSPSSTRSDMVEFQTLKCKVFYNILEPIFYSTGTPKKTINNNLIGPYIGPVSTAAWFCGDGSKADFTANKGKGLTFHCQGFTKAEIDCLANNLSNNLGLSCSSKLDDPKKSQYRLDVSGTSYETFVEKVGPYIHSNFHYRVPEGRVPGSPNGYITKELRASLLGRDLTNLQTLVETY